MAALAGCPNWRNDDVACVRWVLQTNVVEAWLGSLGWARSKSIRFDSECAVRGAADYDLSTVTKTDNAEAADFPQFAQKRSTTCLLPIGPNIVVVVTGDHSTPSIMRSHSCIPSRRLFTAFSLQMAPRIFERGCQLGSLGVMPSSALMSYVLRTRSA